MAENIQKLTVIAGQRDDIETALAQALFGNDQAELERLIGELSKIGIKQPALKLVTKAYALEENTYLLKST